MSKNKIVDYYTPNDERLPEYYIGHSKLLGLDKQPFGLDEGSVLRFETKDANSNIWKRYKELGGSEDDTGDINTLWLEFAKGKFTLEEMMQFYREIGHSLCGYVDVWSTKFYAIEDANEFQKSLEKLGSKISLEEAKKNVLSTMFLANLNGASDDSIYDYRVSAHEIFDKNFGKDSWDNFCESIKNETNDK